MGWRSAHKVCHSRLGKTKSVSGHASIEYRYPDIYSYLVESPGEFTRETLKAYKSLDAFNFVKSGWVDTIVLYRPNNVPLVCLLKTKVIPSQRLSEKPHLPWVAVKKDGAILAGHCTCKAR